MAIGSTAEYLARAALAFHDPLLLAKGGHVESQIMLSRANASDPLDPTLLRSLEISSVWSLLQKLNPRVAPHMNKGGQKIAAVDLVMNVRNAAAHMALVDGLQLEAADRERTQVLLESREVGLVTLERSRNVPAPCPVWEAWCDHLCDRGGGAGARWLRRNPRRVFHRTTDGRESSASRRPCSSAQCATST